MRTNLLEKLTSVSAILLSVIYKTLSIKMRVDYWMYTTGRILLFEMIFNCYEKRQFNNHYGVTKSKVQLLSYTFEFIVSMIGKS